MTNSYTKMGFAGNNDPQFIIPTAIATREAPSAATSGISGRIGGQTATNRRGKTVRAELNDRFVFTAIVII